MDSAARLARQRAIADLGLRALAPADLGTLLRQAVHVVARTLGAEHASILELAPDGGEIRLRAGVGWEEGNVGHRARAEPGGHVAYVLGAAGPIVVEDLPSERRFRPSTLLLEAGVRSSLAVRIPGPDGRAFGVVAVHTTEPRRFLPDEIDFLGGVAAALAGAILRHRQAVELNDTIVQTLVVARYALDSGRAEQATELIDDALEHARALVDALLGNDPDGTAKPMPGDLRRTAAAVVPTPSPER